MLSSVVTLSDHDSWTKPRDVSYDVVKFVYCDLLLCSM